MASMQLHNKRAKGYTIRDFAPLMSIFALVISFTTIRQWYHGWDLHAAMQDFMAAFFLIFGIFKVVNIAGFAEAYATYDIIAKRSMFYAYLYPFLEIGLGLSYLFRFMPFATNLITLVLMLISAVGVGIELYKKRTIVCACLGVLFTVPLTYVTLLEDLLMAAMAAFMLFFE